MTTINGHHQQIHYHPNGHHSIHLQNGNSLPCKERMASYKKALYSDDIGRQLYAVSQLRILLSDEEQPPIDLVIKSNCVPRLIEMLRCRDSINLLFETAWVLTNICSGSHDHTMAVVEAQGIECILSLLDLRDIAVLEQSIWILGNIAGDGTNARDICLQKGVLQRLIRLAQNYQQLTSMTTEVPPNRRLIASVSLDVADGDRRIISHSSPEIRSAPQSAANGGLLSTNGSMSGRGAPWLSLPLSFQRNLVWTVSNLVRGKPQPRWTDVSCVIPVILMYLECPDIEVLTDTCWALSYLSDGCNDHIQSILDLSSLSNVDISQYLVAFLDKKSMNVLVPALRTCGNIVSGSDHQTQQIIDRGLLTKLKRLLCHPNHSVKKEAIWTVSNITAGNPNQIQCVIDHGLIEPLVDILTDYHADHDLVKECIWAISNATTGGTTNQLRYLSQFASIGLSRVMSHFPSDKKLQLVLLEGLDNLLSFTTAHPIPISESPMANLMMHSMKWMERMSTEQNGSGQMTVDTVTRALCHGDMDCKEDLTARQMTVVTTTRYGQKVNALCTIDEEPECYHGAHSNGNAECREMTLAVNMEVNVDGDICGVSSGEDTDFDVMECGVDEDTELKQNYVAYIMEQTEAHRVLEKWYYDANQDRDVAHLAQMIYKKYFNFPFQF